MRDEPSGPDTRSLHLDRWVTGGLCIAHADDRTWFVRFGLPGEDVVAVVTHRARGVIFADVIEVLTPSHFRVQAPCPHFGPGQCGGCDLQHVAPTHHAVIKREFLLDSLSRIARLDVDAMRCVEETREIPTPDHGLRWRTRLTGMRTDDGIGLHRWRSDELVSVADCLIAESPLVHGVLARLPPGEAFRAARGTEGEVGIESGDTSEQVRESVATPQGKRGWRLPVSGFWQVHRGAPQFLGDLVLEIAGSVAGERWWDLYAGAGLFAAFLAGAGASVDMVEADPGSIRAARRAFHDQPAVVIHQDSVDSWVAGRTDRPDGVLVDPPRRGCDSGVLHRILEVRPPRIVYVSCDPASFARDTAVLSAGGYRLQRAVPVDAFPMTHHLETVALFVADDQIS